MTVPAADGALSKTQIELVKRQLVPVLERMSRDQLLDLGDFIYDESRRRASGPLRHWCYEIRV